MNFNKLGFDPFRPHEYLIRQHDFFVCSNGPQRHTSANLPACHSHNGWYELVVVVSGSAQHITSNEHSEFRRLISSGQFFLLHPGVRHYYEDAQDFVIYNILFQAWFLEAFKHDLLQLPGGSMLFSPNHPAVNISASVLPEIIEQCNKIWKLSDNPEQNSSKIRISAIALELLLNLCCNATYKFKDSEYRTAYMVSCIVDYFENHFSENISLAQLAGKFAMSLSVFREKFRSVTGTSAINYLIMLRLRRAMIMLVEKDKTISEVAHAAGFQDSNYFSRQFHKKIGMTPRRFIRLSHSEQQDILKNYIPAPVKASR
ncbi:MAG: helix-turn-helix domain-containing protein [Lentisphaerae bacterium]|nr:helix-turn-helix domain-containing protein [Lentisphaerota bacterium]